MSESNSTPRDYRQYLVLMVAVVCLAIWVWLKFFLHGQSGTAKFVGEGAGRIALVMTALWLAWPSLQRPARWLPPGFAMMLVVTLGILAARPRLIVIAIPALGILLVLATVIRAIKR